MQKVEVVSFDITHIKCRGDLLSHSDNFMRQLKRKV